ncbi:MAG TPA: hypothetical protein VGI97_14710 [Gemmatimonadaceae bacterium]
MAGEDLAVPVGGAAVEDEPAPAAPVQGTPSPVVQRPRVQQPVVTPSPETASAAFVAAQKDPQRHAKVLDLAGRLNMSPAFVDENYDELAKAQDQHSTQYQIDSVSPTLRNWLSDPDNASIAKHEIAPLAQVDRGAKLLTPPSKIDDENAGPLDATGNAIATGMSDLVLSTHLLAAAFGHATPAQAAADIAAAKVRSNSLREQAPAYAKEYAAAIQQHEGDLDAARSAVMAGNGPARKAGILNALVNFGQAIAGNQPMAVDPAAANTLGETISLIGAHVAGLNRVKGFAYQNVESLASMAPILAGTALGTAAGSEVPVVGNVAGGIAGTFVGASGVGIASEIEQEFTKRGVDLADPAAVEKALGDHQLMSDIRSKATKAGLTSAAVMTLFNIIGAKAAGLAGEDASVVAKVGAKTAAIAAPAVGVAAGTEAGKAAIGEPVDPARAISTTLQMLAFGGAEEAVGASRRAMLHPETAAAAAQATDQAEDAMRAQHDAQVLAEVGRAVNDAGTTASVPDRLKSLIETATGGQDAATVYFQSGEWDKYWSDRGASPAKAAADIMGDDGKAYHDAQATGARLAIPLSDYITKVAPTEHFDGLLDVARTRPDGMSFREAQEYLQSLPATMTELADEATKQAKGEQEPMEQSAAQVRADVEDQLVKAGVGPGAAKAQAQLYESAFRNLGERANVSARELFNRYGLTIGRGPLEPTPEATAKLETARRAAEAASAQEATLGTAKAELDVQAKSAEPAVAETAKGRAKFIESITPTFSDEAEAARLNEEEGSPQAAELARPRTASGRLKNLAKATPEELANEYKLLIDANAVENTAPSAIDTGTGATWTGLKPGAMKAMGRIAARAKTIAKLEAEMTKRGMDHAEAYMSGTRNAVNQEPTGFEFNQAAKPVVTETPEFKKWFGKSKVVKDDGTPLEVYHGTVGDFSEFDAGKLGDTTRANSAKIGFFFTDSPRVADSYAHYAATDNAVLKIMEEADAAEKRGDWQTHDAKVEEYEKLEAQFRADTESRMRGQNVVPVYLSMKKPAVVDAKGESFAGFEGSLTELIRKAKADGKDGVIIRNLDDAAGLSNVVADHYVVFKPEQIKSSTGNTGAFDPNDPNILHQAARGRITFGDGREFRIELLKNADRSTFIHETGHFYLEVLGDLAKAPSATEDLKADYQTIREWVGAEGDKPFTREQHEQFARGFEAYLMEGKAPSATLKTAFFRFKNWLLDIYKNVRALGVDLTPEVRGVFDRLLASKEEIADAERTANVEPLYGDPASAGMNADQADRYRKAIADAHQSAEEELSQKMTRDIVREQSAEWKAWRDPMRAEIGAEVGNRPVYKALDYLRGKAPDGTDLPADAPKLKLNKESIVATYGPEFAASLPRGILATAEKGGVNAGVVADMFGFANGRELVDALSKAGNKNTLIDFLTDQRMRDEHGEQPSVPDIKEAAVEAVRGGVKRAQLLKLEAEHLASDDFAAFKGLVKKLNRRAAPDEEVRKQADSVIGSTKVRDIRPDLFEKAAERAHRESTDKFLAGDFQGALDAKEKERMATAVFDAATDAKAQFEKSLDEFKDVFLSDARLEKAYDLNFVNGARAMLAELGIGSSDKGATSYLSMVKEYAPDAYENVQAITEDVRNLGIRDYRDLTTDQFTELRETVDQLWTLARKAKQVVMDGKVQELADVLAPIVQEVVDRKNERVAARGVKKSLDPTDKLANTALSFEAGARRVESWARFMDGLNVLGPLSKVVREVFNATNKYRGHKTDVLERVAKTTEALRGLPEVHDLIAHELGGYTFKDRAELLGAMLHTGNAEGAASNLVKLIVGRGWGTIDENGVLDRGNWDAFVRRMQKEKILTKADYDWLQSSWDYFEELKPELQKAYYAVNARYMKEVGHTPFETPFGTYEGGYYPAIGDTNVAGGAEIENAMRASEDQLLGTDGKFLMTQPASGMTKTRTGKTWPLVMDAGQFPRHLDAVLKYIHMAPPVREVFKVFNHRDFREAMAGVNPAMISDALIPFLRAASSQRSSAPETTAIGKAFSRAINYVRQGAMQQVVGANLVILAEQVLHTSALQAMRTPDNKARVYYHDVAGAAARIVLSPNKLTDMIHEASATIATRDHARLRAAEVQYKDIMDPSKLRTMQEFAAHGVGFVSNVMSSLMDKAVWLGARDRAEQRGIHGQDAVDYADNVVREGLGGHNPEDIAEIQRGTAMQKAMLGLYGFFNAKANQLGTDAFAKTMTDAGLKSSKQRMAAVYVFGLLALSVSGAAARDVIGGRKKKDDETWTDVLAEWAGWGQFEAVARFVPGGNVAVQSAKFAFHHAGASADNMLSSPTATFLDESAGAFRAGHRAVTGEQITGKDVKDALGFFGTLLHLPLKTLARPISYQMDLQQGKTTPTGPIDYTRGLITGQRGR